MFEAVDIRQIPNQRLWKRKAAARYLGMSVNTLQEKTEGGEIPAKRRGREICYTIEVLDGYIDDLPDYARGSLVSEEGRTTHGR